MIIDGSTQPGYAGSPIIELNGALANAIDGLSLTAGGCTVKALVINRFPTNIHISSKGGNRIVGCFIGVNVAGASGFGQTGVGIYIDGTDFNSIGEEGSLNRNVISACSDGISIAAGGKGNLVVNNYIGTDKTGLLDIGNSNNGIGIYGAPSNTIGGVTASQRNLISGNDNAGILLHLAGTINNAILGNYIGTNATGKSALGNNGGIALFEGALNTIIGGSTTGSGNVISGNNSGITIAGPNLVSGTVVQGNLIGTDSVAEGPVPNNQGIRLISGDNTIGGIDPGAGNTIAFNTSTGISIIDVAGTGISIRGNSIHDNGLLGIDLKGDGVTFNDPGDADAGPNSLVNFPIITEAVSGVNSSVTGLYNGLPNVTITIDVYASSAADPSNHGEGARYLGSTSIATDANGDATFGLTGLVPIQPGEVVSSIATDSDFSSSEFSVALKATTEPFVVSNANVTGPGSLAQAIDDANLQAGPDTITFDPVFFATAKTITLAGELSIGEAVTIQGPGFGLLTISGNNSSRIFNTTFAPTGAAFLLSGLTLTAAKSNVQGGAIIAADEQLTLTNCVVSNNTSGGGLGGGAIIVTSGGMMTATDCTFSNNSASLNGGAIAVLGGASSKLILQRCSVSGNIAGTGGNGSGGGLYISGGGYLLIVDSTIAGNAATNTSSRGGGILANGTFAAGALTIRNSTISGNSAELDGGGIALFSVTGTLVVQNTTIAFNTASGAAVGGGGIAKSSGSAVISLESSVVSSNTNAKAPDIASLAGTVNAKTSSIFSSLGFTLTDQGSNRPFGEDPLLDTLKANGGPTFTHQPLPGSPLVNAGSNPAGLVSDQRGAGFPRVQLGAPDIGSIELSLVRPTVATDIHNELHNSVVSVPLGSIVHDSVTVTGAPLGPTPTGTVTLIFYRDNAPIGIAGPEDEPPLATSTQISLSAGGVDAISFSQGPLAAGNYYFRSTYNGDTNYTSKIGPAEFLTVEKQQLTISTDIHNVVHQVITSAPLGSVVHDTAMVSGIVSGFAPTGAVSFFFNGSPIATVGMEGKAFRSTDIGPLAAGTYMFAATVAGDSNYLGATSAVEPLTVNGGAAVSIATEIHRDAIDDGPPFVVSGGSVDTKTIVHAAAGVNGSEAGFTPTGTVTFSFYNTPDGTGPVIDMQTLPLPMDGVIDLALLKGPLMAGDYSYKARYNGDSNYAPNNGPIPSLKVIADAMRLMVDATNDEGIDTDGKMSLREAILAANKTAVADTIEFDATIFGSPQTITLTLGEIPIANALAIVGRGAAMTTVSGGMSSRIFNTSSAPGGANISIFGLTLTAGNATGDGGAIVATGQNLSISSCAFSNNVAAGSGGAVSITGGQLSVDFSAFVDNMALGDGGAIELAGGLAPPPNNKSTIVNTTLVGNGGTRGGAIKIEETGPDALSFYASTIVNNTATMGGGGIDIDPAGLLLVSSIVYGNMTGGMANDVDVSPGSALDYSYCDVGTITSAGTVDGKFNMSTNPMLGPLADNGGPTLTMRPMRGSPLINTGLNSASEIQIYDQRGKGQPRVLGGATDIGSVETTYLPGVLSVIVNDGSSQRSRVTSIRITFDAVVTLPNNAASAFQLVRQGDGATVDLAATVVNSTTTVVTLVFPGALSEVGSLADGRYTLTVLASQVINASGKLDGNGDAMGGDNYILASAAAPAAPTNIYRLFGDGDGDGDVDSTDFGAFRANFGGALAAFDFDNDGDVDTNDLAEFRLRFGATI